MNNFTLFNGSHTLLIHLLNLPYLFILSKQKQMQPKPLNVSFNLTEAIVLSVKLCGKKWVKPAIKVHANLIRHQLKSISRLAILKQYLLKKKLSKFNRKLKYLKR